jgi:hypothetical protein
MNYTKERVLEIKEQENKEKSEEIDKVVEKKIKGL